MFCPNCKYEYKPGIEECPDCGAELVEKLERPEPTTERESKFVFLCTAQDLISASLIKETLEKNHITCWLKKLGGVMATLEPLSAYAEIYVPEEKYQLSRKIKEQLVGD